MASTLESKDYVARLGYTSDEAKQLVKPAKSFNEWANTDKHDPVRGSFGQPTAIITEFDAMSGPIEKMLEKHVASKT